MFNAQRPQPFGVLTRLHGLNRRHIDQHAARPHRRRHAQPEHDFFHHRAVVQHRDNDVGIAHGIGSVGVNVRAEGREALGFFGGAIPCVYGKTRLAQPAPHRITH